MDQSKEEARTHYGLFLFQRFKPVWHHMLDLVFPPRCQHCGRVDAVFCDTCQRELERLPTIAIKTTLSSLDGVLSTGVHMGILQSSVQALKYGGQRDLGFILAQRIDAVLSSQDWQYDTIIPVPLHTTRLQERGYNQAKEISRHLAVLSNTAHQDTWLIRRNQTQSQVGLNRDERIENVKEAFEVTSHQLQDMNILLVDDVRTTGATLVACADALIKNGAGTVYAVSVSAAE